jgi:hypothetical protein
VQKEVSFTFCQLGSYPFKTDVSLQKSAKSHKNLKEKATFVQSMKRKIRIHHPWSFLLQFHYDAVSSGVLVLKRAKFLEVLFSYTGLNLGSGD